MLAAHGARVAIGDWKRFWPIRPTYVRGGIDYGTLRLREPELA
ncbi:hypothetical protein C6A86_025815 [Mycobacterium sp. ITM-2016-00316]|nr:hypothetical protein [Mycobacterium sp. ITM-2016-00316]WNG81548.1 hypothetical protein C6A86_025815 [Mycobacterium sp. ITM-2016-00316]